jgi:type I restriction enzyme, S subunit
MNNWIDSTVADVTKYQKAGGTPVATNPDYYGGDIPFVVIEDITKSSRFLEKTEKNLSDKGLLNSAAWFIHEPHVLYSMYATVGKPIINKISCATNQAIIALKENDLIEQEFLYYQLLFIRPSVYKFTAQTTQLNLNAGVVKRLPISYPESKKVQREITKILSTIDQTITHTEALIEKYQQIKAGLMHDLFTRGIGADGKLRPPRDQAPEMYRESSIGWIPKEWNIASFGEHVEVIDPNPSHRYPLEADDGYPICSTENFDGEDNWNFSKSKYVPESTYQSQNNKCRFKSTDVIFARKGKIGLARLYGQEKKVFSHTVVLMKPSSEFVDTYWLLWLSRSDWMLKAIDVKMNTNSGVPTLGVEFIKNIAVPFPPDYEQKIIHTLLESASNRIRTSREECKKLIKQKSGLMHDLLTGKVQVNIDSVEEVND